MIEPNDELKMKISKNRYLISALKLFFNKIINRKYTPYLPDIKDAKHSYEDIGNCVYSVSNREIDKIVHAMDLSGMAYYEFNDSYVEGVEFEIAEENNALFKQIKKISRNS